MAPCQSNMTNLSLRTRPVKKAPLIAPFEFTSYLLTIKDQNKVMSLFYLCLGSMVHSGTQIWKHASDNFVWGAQNFFWSNQY